MPIQDTDNLIVGRGSDAYKIEYGQIKSDITSGSSGYVKLDDGGTKQVIESGGLGISNGTTENITLGADGSGTFVSGLTKLTAGGSLFLETTSTAEGIYGGKVGSGVWNYVLDASNGNATFKGLTDTQGLTSSYATFTVPAGQTDSSWGSINVIDTSNNPTAQIFGNGSALFQSTVNAKGGYSFIGRDASDTAVFAVGDTGYVNIGPVSGSNSNIILDGATGNGTFVGKILATPGDTQAFVGENNSASQPTFWGKNKGTGPLLDLRNNSDTQLLVSNTGDAAFKGTVSFSNLAVENLPALQP